MPYGEYQYSVDDKGRVILPPSFRDFVEDGMVLTRGLEGCLYIFPSASWKRLEDRLGKLPLTDTQAQNFVRFFYSGAAKVSTDNAGRITIPASLRAFAEAQNNVVIAGAPNRLEIWNEARWHSNIASLQDNLSSLELLQEIAG